MPYLRNSIYSIWSWILVHLWKLITPGIFFIFSKLLIFRVVRGVKGQKMVQNNRKFCQPHFISQESFIIWLSFIVHIYKTIISSVVFFIFSNFWFSGPIGGNERAKKWSKMTKNLSVLFHIVIYGVNVWNDNILRCFFSILKFIGNRQTKLMTFFTDSRKL